MLLVIILAFMSGEMLNEKDLKIDLGGENSAARVFLKDYRIQ